MNNLAEESGLVEVDHVSLLSNHITDNLCELDALGLLLHLVHHRLFVDLLGLAEANAVVQVKAAHSIVADAEAPAPDELCKVAALLQS